MLGLMKNMKHQIDNGLILSAEGIPEGYKWFCDGRLSFSFDEGGVGCVEYYGARSFDANQMVFKKGIFHCFRTFIVKEHMIFSPKLENIVIWPHGLSADLRIDEGIFKFEVRAIEESIVFSLTAPAGLGDEYKFRMQFFESTQLITAETDDYLTGTRGLTRTWQPWKWNSGENYLTGGYEDAAHDKNVSIHFRVGANRPATYSNNDIHPRITLDTLIKPGETNIFAITPETCQQRAAKKHKLILGDYNERCRLQKAAYQSIRDKSPQLTCDNPGLSAFFSLAPLYSQSLKIPDSPGAVRAKTTRYWVWGWDTIVKSLAPLYWGDAAHIRDMLIFFEDTSSPDVGLSHAYATDNSSASPMAAAAQGMYICLLHHYFSLTGDETALKRHYPFAKTILTRMLTAVTAENGLMKGMSLYPDFPHAMMETGDDLSLYNNSLAYCSLRAMEFLAGVCRDDKTVEMLTVVNQKIRENFTGTFFNDKLGAYVNSVDATTLEQRKCINIGSLMWENDFLEELVRPKDSTYARFIEEHCIGTAYFRAIPLWDNSFDGDANQLHCTWPVVEENVMRLMRRQGKTQIIKKWSSWVSYWTGKLIVPEGISYMIETESPETDSWNCEPGTWQAYTMRQWYQDILHSYLGITLDYGGISVGVAVCGAYQLSNLSYMGGRINIVCSGSGAYVGKISVNGNAIYGTRKIPFDMLNIGGVTDIEIELAKSPPILELTGCYNAQITDYEYENGKIGFNLGGSGHIVLRFAAAKKIHITKDGVPLICNENNDVHADMHLSYGKKHRIEAM